MSRSIVITGEPEERVAAVAGAVAGRLGRGWVDVHGELERHLQRPIATVIEDIGVDGLREFEHQVLRQVVVHEDLVVTVPLDAARQARNQAEILLTAVLVTIGTDTAGPLLADVASHHAIGDAAAALTDDLLAWARAAGDVLTPSEHEVTM